MRLIRVTHEVCGEPLDKATYLICPESWSDEEMVNRLEAARDAYLAYLRELKENPPPERPAFHGWGGPDWRKVDQSMTVAEVWLEYNAGKDAFTAWQAERDKQRAGLMRFLEHEGFVLPWQVEDPEVERWNVELWWGHNHGLGIDYQLEDEDWPRARSARRVPQ